MMIKLDANFGTFAACFLICAVMEESLELQSDSGHESLERLVNVKLSALAAADDDNDDTIIRNNRIAITRPTWCVWLPYHHPSSC